jgi:hypothetical protein
MSSTVTRRNKRERRREPWRLHAARHGVSTRTLDRWVIAGILNAPEVINGRKYGDPTAEPRRDPAPGK